MLDRDLARLAATGPEISLSGLEPAIWSKVDVLTGQRRFERLASRLRFAAFGVALIVSVTIGMKIAGAPDPEQGVMQISAAAAELAPSTLFGPRH
ncbi:MAG: hypothetical protein ACR2FH_03120 [Caulobacteraceae bacterium]